MERRYQHYRKKLFSPAKRTLKTAKCTTFAEPALVDYSMSAPRVQVTWQEISERSENETNCRIQSEESDVPPSESEDDLPLESYIKNGSWKTLKTNTTQSKEFLLFDHGERTTQNPIHYFRKHFTHYFLNTLCEKANLYRAANDINATFTVNKKDNRITIYSQNNNIHRNNIIHDSYQKIRSNRGLNE